MYSETNQLDIDTVVHIYAKDDDLQSHDLSNAQLRDLREAAAGATIMTYPGGGDYERALFVSMGDAPFSSNHSKLQSTIHSTVQALRSHKVPRAVVRLDPKVLGIKDEHALHQMLRHVTHTAILSEHSDERRMTTDERKTFRLQEVALTVEPATENLREIVLEQAKLSAATCLAKDVANSRANEANCAFMAQVATEIGLKHSMSVEVLEYDQMLEKGMGLITAVGRSGPKESQARIVLMEHKGDPGTEETVVVIQRNSNSCGSRCLTSYASQVVGKGLVFDTGGLNLKPTGSMESMFLDKHGACTVLGLMDAVGSMGLKANVVGVVALAENSVGPEAYRPSDILTSLKGTTVAVNNTDAEGRLVLADAMTYAQKKYKGVHTMIDVATLTGAMVVALGEYFGGVFTTSEALGKELAVVGKAVDEEVWRMPLGPLYTKELEHPECDIASTGKGRAGGSCTAAAFLEHFVEKDVAWAHIDIAGVGMIESARGHRARGGTGWGVQLLARWLQDYHTK